MRPVFEAVPNFSEGRDPEFLRAAVRAIELAGGDVLDASSDRDHHRSVITFLGSASVIVEAAAAAAAVALERIDLRRHRGLHPRVGALDVFPVVPMRDADLEDAADVARSVGRRLVALGVPVHYYAHASPSGRGLAELRRGGFEALAATFPKGREPDEAPPGTCRAHPTAGVTCVGARQVLLAWNVFVEGTPMAGLRDIAASLREAGGGFAGLRVLALELPEAGRRQLAMNLEDLGRTSPLDVFRTIEARVAETGGAVVATEVIGMIPDGLVLPAARGTFKLLGGIESRVLSNRVERHVSALAQADVMALLGAIEAAGRSVPKSVRLVADRVRPSIASSMSGTAP